MTEHQESFTEKPSDSNQNSTEQFKSFNPTATEDPVIPSPERGRRDIELHKPLFVATARYNRSDSYTDGNDDRDENKIFDEELCEIAELALQTAGLQISSVGLHKVRGVMLRVARDLDSFEDLAEHVSDYSDNELKQFGLQRAYESSTYRKAAKALKNTGSFEDVVEATFIAIYALFRRGVPLPTSVAEKYELDYEMGPAGSDFAAGPRDLSLYNLIEDLLQVVLAELDLNREVNKSRDIRSLLGVFAYTAHHELSIEDYDQSAHHSHDLDNALSGSSIRAHIDDLELWQVEEMFDDINQALLEYVIESGVISKSVMVSYDLTDVQSIKATEYDDMFRTANGQWRFASLSFTDPALDFSFGLRLLKSESQRARMLKNFLRDLTSMVDVKLFMADRGFDSREDIEACRAFIPESWIICAQHDTHPSGQNNDYTRLREQLDPGDTAVVEYAGYDELYPSTKLIGYSGSSDDTDSIEPVRAFYTDIQFPTDDDERAELITDINFCYNQRGKIESLFRMAKNKFDVSADTSNPVRKAFYFNISALFYNLYNIVNTVPSPRSGLELTTTQKEFLEVTEKLALGGPTLPDALQYHREHY
ncbi:hypothetical protein [Haloarcula laminariae]|uniref:hypothetical protein n=1 Tax=Haloarcula laminariae TaxID=2961577 RepID=UPI0021C782BB|nr:hypothetical protein [Halomicroarcula laminariae]